MKTLSKKFDTIEAVTSEVIKEKKHILKDPLTKILKTGVGIETSVKNNN